jgi:8-oxo-dGTP diphosphatase
MIDVVAAIIENDKKEILIAKRKLGKSQGGLWEFPGGKVEEGEKLEESLIRELKEEMNIEIEVIKYFEENVHHYEKISIRLIAFKAIIISREIELKDHEEYVWVQANKLKEFEFAPADICFVEKLIKLLK